MANTATITPTLGSAPVTLQAGNYSAIDDRRFWGATLDEGVLSAGSYQVIQRAAGANMTVDVASSVGEGAIVTGDSVTAQGKYMVPPTAANVNVDIAAADATNPRNDLVVLEVKDDQHDAGGLNLARVRVITGTPNASAALTDAPGANGTPALPSSCQLLAVVRVAAGATSITTAAISNRRVLRTGWTSYTPVLQASTTNPTIGATPTGRYAQYGKLVIYQFYIEFGASAAAGSGIYRLVLPVTSTRSTMTGNVTLGEVRMYDSSANSNIMTNFFVHDNDAYVRLAYAPYTGGGVDVTNAAPWTWASGDVITGTITYEAA